MAIQSARSARLLGLAIVALAPLLVAPQVEAQISTGDLTGRVEDEQGTRLPGVTVTATSPSLQGVRVVVSDGNGNYKVPLLPAGTYRALSVAAVVLSMIPCLGPCCYLGVPVGAWALVVLLDADVKASFTS